MSGGTKVSINGNNFVPGSTTIQFGSAAATNVSCPNTNLCTATAPPGTGTVDITLTTPAGTSAPSRSDEFSYGPPTVTGVIPAMGPPSGGTSVVITGTGFTSDTSILFGTSLVPNLSCTSSTICQVASPGGSGTVDVSVTTPGGTSTSSQADQFGYSGTAVSVVSASAAGGQLNSVSCPVRGWCGGVSSAGGYDLLVTGIAGDWTSTVAPFPAGATTTQAGGTAAAVACPSVGICWAAGAYFDTAKGTQLPVLYKLSNGSWQANVVPLPAGGVGGFFRAISCSSVSFCAASGIYSDSSGFNQGLLATMSGGSFVATESPPIATSSDPDRTVVSVTCPADGWCVATLNTQQKKFLVNLANGTWTVMNPIAPPSGVVGSITSPSCPSAGWCLLYGDFTDSSGTRPVLETYANGSWSVVDIPIPQYAPKGASVVLSGITSCAVEGWCVASAKYDYVYIDNYGHSSLATATEMLILSNGSWTASTLTEPFSASPGYFDVGPLTCPQVGSCTGRAATVYNSGQIPASSVLTLESGGWTQSYPASWGLLDVSCPIVSWCAIVGTDGNQALVDYVQYGGTQTRVSLSSSNNPVPVQFPVTYTAQVTPVPDSGTVGFYNFSTAIPGCSNQPIDPSTGRATCTVSVSNNQQVTADYFGDSTFAESASPWILESVNSPTWSGWKGPFYVPPPGLASPPSSPPGPPFVGNGSTCCAPAVVSWEAGRLDLFVEGGDRGLWHRWSADGGSSWSAWENLGGVLSDGPAAVSWGLNRIDVFVKGSDSQLWHKWWDGSNWSVWEPLGGLLNSAPTVSSWQPGRLDVFVQGGDNAIWHKWWDGTAWRGWESRGGVGRFAPAAVSWGPGRVDLFTVGSDAGLWHQTFTGGAWSGWAKDVGGTYSSSPGVASWGPNRLDLFLASPTSTGTQMVHVSLDGTWHSESLGGRLASGPGVAFSGGTHLDVFVQGSDRNLWWGSYGS